MNNETEAQKVERLERRVRDLETALDAAKSEITSLQTKVSMLGGYY